MFSFFRRDRDLSPDVKQIYLDAVFVAQDKVSKLYKRNLDLALENHNLRGMLRMIRDDEAAGLAQCREWATDALSQNSTSISDAMRDVFDHDPR